VDSDSSDPDPDPDLNPKRLRSGEDFDIIIGFLGFWALVLFVLTAFLEVTGKPALLPALILLAVVLAIWGMVRLRKRLPARRAGRSR
jgi:hypothetical protein